jgi:hypothetical protein
MSSSGRWAAGVALVGAGVLAVAAPAAAADHTVALVGDSLLGQSSDEVRPALEAGGWRVVLEHVNGSGASVGNLVNEPYDWTTEVARLEQVENPEVLVIVLGTNDALAVDAAEPYGPDIDRVLAGTDAPRIYWADCSQHTAVQDRNDGCALIQGALFDAKNRHAALQVLPFDAEVASDPQHSAVDSVHLSEHGQDLFASLIDRYVGRAPK